MKRLRELVRAHLDSRQVGRVIAGSIIGLALVVSSEDNQPQPAVMAAELLATGLVFALSEAFGDIVGKQARVRRRVNRSELRAIGWEVAGVAVGIAFPAIFFLLAVVGVMTVGTAFVVSRWVAVALIGCYGFAAAHLAGVSNRAALLDAAVVALIASGLIELKALIH